MTRIAALELWSRQMTEFGQDGVEKEQAGINSSGHEQTKEPPDRARPQTLCCTFPRQASREPDQKESFLTRIDRSYSQPLGRSDFPTIANQCKYYIRRGARDVAGNISSFTSSGWEDIVLCRLRLEDHCTKEIGKEATRPAIKGQAFKSTMRNTADRHRRYWQLMGSVETRHGGEQANKLCSTMQLDSHCRKRRCVLVETKF